MRQKTRRAQRVLLLLCKVLSNVLLGSGGRYRAVARLSLAFVVVIALTAGLMLSYSDKLPPVVHANGHEDPGLNSGNAIVDRTTVPGETILKYQTTGANTFTAPVGVTNVRVLVVGGGGSGGNNHGGGGGAGEAYHNASLAVTPGTAVPITVGAGGVAQAANGAGGNDGGDSTFGSVTVNGGGGGGSRSGSAGKPGGSGGGGGGNTQTLDSRPGGASVLTGSGQGSAGGTGEVGATAGSSVAVAGVGGGGGGAAGAGASAATDQGGSGGSGIMNDITGANVGYAGGGGGNGWTAEGSAVGSATHGGGAGAAGDNVAGTSAVPNTGAGGGGGGPAFGDGGAGGSGVVIVRFTTQAREEAPGGALDNLLVWLKADTGVVGTSAVTAWNDQSGNGNSATEQILNPGQSLVTNGLNFNPVVNFNGAGGFRGTLNTGSLTSNNISAFVVMKPNTTGSQGNARAFTVFQNGQEDHNTANGAILLWRPGATTNLAGYRSGGQRGTVSNVFGQFGLFGSHFRTTNEHSMIYNGGTPATVTFGAAAFNANRYGLAVNAGPAPREQTAGDYAEVILYETDQITAGTAERIESYLGVKWGLTLGHNYVASDGTVLWDHTANNGFNSDITGIGRDDISTLHQKQSKSANPGAVLTIGANNTIATDNAAHTSGLADDKSYLVVGDNGAVLTPSAKVANTDRTRSGRIWKAEESGPVGPVRLRIPKSMVSDNNPVLLRSTDATFDGTDAALALTPNGSDYEVDIDLADGEYFTFAADIAAPGGVTEAIEYWIRPEEMETTGGVISNWDDAHGRHTNETMMGGGFNYTPNAFNFNPAASSNGDRYMRFTNEHLLSDATAGEVFYMLESTGAHNTDDGYPSEIGGGGSANTWEYDYSNSNLYSGWGSTSRRNWNPSLAPAGGPARDVLDPHIYNVVSKAGEWAARFDGITNFTGTNAVNFNSTNSGHTLIGSSNASIFRGRMSELIAFRRDLTATERQRVQSYLATKYGVSLGTTASPSDYLDSDGAPFWTGSSTYQNRVTVIGRDDGSLLEQKQSRSVAAGAQVTVGHGNTIAADNATNSNGFAADKSFLAFGDDNGTTSPAEVVSGTAPLRARMDRTWHVEETGSVGSVKVRIPASIVVGDNPALMYSADATFDSGDTVVELTPNGADLEADIDMGDGYFTVISSPPAPGGVVSGLEYWIRPEEMTVTGSQVTNWNDVYGQHTNEVMAGGGFDFVANGINFNASAGSNANRYMSFPNQQLLSGATAGEIFYSLENTGAANFVDGYPSAFGGGGSDATWQYDWRDGQLYSGWGSTTRKIWNPLQAPAGGPPRNIRDPKIYNVLSKTGEWTARLDGLPNFTTSTNTPNFNTSQSGHTYVGAAHNAVFRGKISELIAYRNDLTAVERERVQSYLALKYGITLGADTDPFDYVASDGSTVFWPASTTYQNNIAGIGRDDGSQLSQKQSRSGNTSHKGDILTIGHRSIEATNSANANGFADNKSFMVWGDNAASTGQNALVGGTSLARMDRVWKVEETGTVGDVRLRIPEVVLGDNGPVMIVSDDETFDSSDTQVPLSLAGSNLEATHDFLDGKFFTFASVVESPAPGGVGAGLKLWLKADTGTSSAVDNTTVGTWNDNTSHNHDATQSTAANQPTFKRNATDNINFNPVVKFDGANDQMALDVNKLPTETSARTITGVGNLRSANSWKGLLSYGAAVNSRGVVVGNYGSRLAHAGYANDDYSSASFVWPTTAGLPQEIMMSWAGGTNTPFNIFSKTATAVGPINKSFDTMPSGNAFLGTVSWNTGLLWNGDMAEVIVHEKELNANERRRVSSYLALKYGYTLSQSPVTENYVDSAGATIWPGNSTYKNDIAGIGRDDGSALNQKQSKCSCAANLVTVGHGTVAADNASNPNNFTADKSFMIWGHDNGAINTWSATGVTNTPLTNFKRINRTWHVEETGAVGNTTVTFNVNNLSANIPDAINGYYLLRDANNNDSFADDTPILLTDAGSGNFTAGGVNFSDGEEFTLATFTAQYAVEVIPADTLTSEDPVTPDTGSFKIRLKARPSAPVTITLSSSNPAEGTVPASITIQPDDWNNPDANVVTVTGVDDSPPAGDGAVSYIIQTTDVQSADPGFDALADADVADVSMVNQNDDPPGIAVAVTDITSGEDGSTARVQIRLLSQPLGGADVTIPLSLSDSTEGSLSVSSVTIANADWNTPVEVTITGLDDSLIDGDILYELLTGDPASADAGYDALTAADVADPTLQNIDNDVPNVNITESGDSTNITEGGATDSLSLVLATQPAAGKQVVVRVQPGPQIDLGAGPGTAVLLTFDNANWNTPQTVTVTAADDTDLEGSHADQITFSIDVAATTEDSYDSLSLSGYTADITDNDTVNVSITKLNDGAENPADDAEFEVSLSGPNSTGSPITVNYSFAGTAAAGDDYGALSGNVEIPDGATSALITATPAGYDDDLLEQDETITVTLTGTNNLAAAIDTSQDEATAILADDEVAFAQLSVTQQGNEAGTPIIFTVTLDKVNNTGAPITFTIAPSGGTATAPDDYADFAGQTITITPGASTGTLSVNPVDNNLLEGNKTVQATISNPSIPAITIGNDTATATITEDDNSPVAIMATDATAAEQPADTGTFTISLPRPNNTGAPITVTYSVGGSAAAGSDFAPLSGSVDIPDGADSATIVIDTSSFDDTDYEGNETVVVSLTGTGHSNTSLGSPAAATVTIADDEQAPDPEPGTSPQPAPQPAPQLQPQPQPRTSGPSPAPPAGDEQPATPQPLPNPVSPEVETPHDDGDGISAEDEDRGPNNGDGNGDGIPDKAQASVATAISPVTGKPVTLEVKGGDCQAIKRFKIVDEAGLEAHDGGYRYPHGLFDYELSCSQAGQGAEVTLYFDSQYSDDWTWRKFNRFDKVYATLNSGDVRIGTAKVGEATVTTARYHVQDGQAYDEDGQANGTIIDPAGPGIQTKHWWTNIWFWLPWPLLLLILLIRRRKKKQEEQAHEGN